MSNLVTPSRTAGERRIYLDHNATTPLHPRVAEAMARAFALGGNPSSIHQEGRRAREAVEQGRRQLAVALGAEPADLVFTSGGTEADCLGVVGLFRAARAAGRPPRVLSTAIEHPALLGAARALADGEGAELELLPVDAGGRLAPDTLAAALAGRGAALLAISAANHEIGSCQPVAELAALCRDGGALLFCDAVQAFGKLPLRVGSLGADAVAISGHKVYGPKGIGALWVSPERDLPPLFSAGHQERGRRPGTENVIGAVALGEAAALAAQEREAAAAHMTALGARLEEGVRALEGARIHGGGAGERVPGTVNVGFAGAPGEVVVQALDLAGIAASTGAACTSGTLRPSAVLLALGLPAAQAAEAVRFSLGRNTRAEEIDEVLAALPEIVERARRYA